MDYKGDIDSYKNFHGSKYEIDGRKAGLTNTIWPINRKIIELNLVDFCNLRCPNCEACCDILPSKKFLPLTDIKKMVDDAIRLRYHFERLKLTGGEPSLHLCFLKIIDIISQYRDFDIKAVRESNLWLDPCIYKVLTNGTKSLNLSTWLSVETNKTLESKVWHIFESSHVAFVDSPSYDGNSRIFRKGCHRVTRCGGIALGCNGKYYPCLMAYHIDRVFELGLGLSDLESILHASDEQLRDILQETCKYCGLFKYPRDLVSDLEISPSWQKALDKHGKNP